MTHPAWHQAGSTKATYGRLWAAARIKGYLNNNQLCYMGPANQWDAEQQWMFDRVVEALVMNLHTLCVTVLHTLCVPVWPYR
jgi:hypothetical protein